MKKALSTILIVYSLSALGQDSVFRKYDLEKISLENNFFTLTRRENKIDSSGEESHRSFMQSIKNGTAFLKKQTHEEIERSIEIENLTYLRFKDNRGRFNTYTYSDQTKDTSKNQMWSKTMCYLNKDHTIEIFSGNGIFGSESITIRLNKDQYYSTYSVDIGKQKIFKRNTSDSISTNKIDVGNIESSLKLSQDPAFTPGEQLMGSLVFKTEIFLRDSEYNNLLYLDKGTSDLYNEIYVAGTVMFTCKVRDIEILKSLSDD